MNNEIKYEDAQRRVAESPLAIFQEALRNETLDPRNTDLPNLDEPKQNNILIFNLKP